MTRTLLPSSPGCTLLVALAALCTAAAAPAQKAADAIVEPSAKAPRGKLLEWKSAQGRTYWYRLPKTIDAKNPPDLVLMLHGTGLDHGWSFWNYPILGDFRRRDIVISPDGLTPGQGKTFNFVQGPKDGEQIAGLIADFKKAFPVGRVYLYGHSQGAFFVYWFAGEHPELVDGIVAHAGNVLQVKHSKLSRQKVAIAILHGRADAVVPVDCAIRSEKIYRDEGYEKLKLEIVDGLTDQSGHWPLPEHVGKLFDWLDQMSTQSAAQAVEIVGVELRKASPDLATIAAQVKKARTLLPKAKDDEKKELPPVLDALQAFLDRAMIAHSDQLLAGGEVLDPKAVYGPWAERFLRLDRAFADNAEWKKRMQKARDLGKAHERLVEKAKKGLDKNTRESRLAAATALEEAFLAPGAADLRSLLEQACTNSKPPDEECQRKVQATLAARTEPTAAAQAAAVEVEQPLLDELKAKVPQLFEREEAAAKEEKDGGDGGR